MNIYINPERGTWEALASRRRSDDNSVDETVAAIIRRVRKEGDMALCSLSREIDRVELSAIEVSDEEKVAASGLVPDKMKAALSRAAENIMAFHKAQIPAEISVETMP